MKLYVLGFVFDSTRNDFALIQKTKPEWQAGRLNGIGGKIEETDASPGHAIVREFEEEAGVNTPVDQWQFRGRMIGEDWLIYVFAAFTDAVYAVHTTTEERVIVASSPLVEPYVIENVAALVELCRIPNAAPSGDPPIFELTYKGQH